MIDCDSFGFYYKDIHLTLGPDSKIGRNLVLKYSGKLTIETEDGVIIIPERRFIEHIYNIKKFDIPIFKKLYFENIVDDVYIEYISDSTCLLKGISGLTYYD